MGRGNWQATVHRVAESDMTEVKPDSKQSKHLLEIHSKIFVLWLKPCLYASAHLVLILQSALGSDCLTETGRPLTLSGTPLVSLKQSWVF